MKFTGDIHRDMMCSCCSDKNNAKHKINDAKRILNLMERKIDIRCLRPFMRGVEHNKVLRKLANSHNHVHFMCGTCRQVNIRELVMVENQINEYLAAIILYMETIERDKAYSLKRELFNLFRGHYPIAARLIDRMDIERKEI